MLESRAQRVHLSNLEWPFTKIVSRLLPALGLTAHSRDLSLCHEDHLTAYGSKPRHQIAWGFFGPTSLCPSTCTQAGDSPCGPVVGTLPSNSGSMGSIPGEEARTPTCPVPTTHPLKNKKRSNVVTNSMKIFKMVHISLLKKHAYRVISHVFLLYPLTDLSHTCAVSGDSRQGWSCRGTVDRDWQLKNNMLPSK